MVRRQLRNDENPPPFSSGAGERFPATSGRIPGVLLIGLGLGVLALAIYDRAAVAAWVGALGAFAAILGWSFLVRPSVSIGSDHLELRNPLSTITIPLAAIEEIAISSYLAVRAGEKRFTSPALGRPLRTRLRTPVPTGDLNTAEGLADASIADYAEHRIRTRAADAREEAGIGLMSPEQDELARSVQRRPAWPEIIALLGSLAAVVVLWLS